MRVVLWAVRALRMLPLAAWSASGSGADQGVGDIADAIAMLGEAAHQDLGRLIGAIGGNHEASCASAMAFCVMQAHISSAVSQAISSLVRLWQAIVSGCTPRAATFGGFSITDRRATQGCRGWMS